ncbi:hypothetical protein GQ651_01560 [Alphaproteobacteria bacterium GH1-50]|uniref:Lipoprotein n=1 Tax=Kangsaoukella pontilimi TaxID=2691042 RepID=A0A7C9IR16_9RHOB|nr:hypothetical protein [Kangsaoukella pontilimi]MXQ06525.1 hypothetical protein [Kangsaoukella pontilimi]
MSDQNKILTVSYGTFSCTLEGFDDPFGTMRGIAEYFRDLAAEDRYFGAEPPTPDVEALQAIAQKAIRNRVDARVGETGIALRATDTVEDAEIAEAPAPRSEPASEAARAPEPAQPEVAEAPVAEAAPARAEEVSDTAPLAFDDDYLMADEPEDVLTVDIDAAPARREGAPESIAEKLRRIRAVVSRNIEPAQSAVPGFDAEDQGDDDASALAPPRPRRDRALTETIASISADIAEDEDETFEAADDAHATAAPETEESRAAAETAPEAGSNAVDAADDAEDDEVHEAEFLSGDAPDEFEDDDFDDDDFDDVEDIRDAAPSAPVTETGEDDGDHTAQDAASVAATIAALNKARVDEEPVTEALDEDDEDAVAETETPEWDLLADDDDIAPTEVSAKAREDAEALAWAPPVDDVAELDTAEDAVELAPTADAKVETDLDDHSDDAADADEDEAPAATASADDVEKAETHEDDATRSAAETLEPLSETNGNVGRLLKETDQKFAEDEGVRRRRVISQMRAAVAATKADRFFSKSVSPEEKTEAEQSPYRRDLNRVITSEVTPGPISAQPSEEPAVKAAPVQEAAPEPRKPAPLVLVSSQRVDAEPTPVAPRPAKPVGTSGSFAEFAADMGAEELPDLLEAAAAYSAFVEGQPHFSRPEIMKRVARIDPALSLSREAGLRSFGMLLRQGKIRKLQRGQFTIAEDTRFNPAHRIAGE